MLNALTIDLEEWYHAELVRPWVPVHERTSRVREALPPLLDVLERHNVRATFFVVGEVAAAHPDLIQMLLTSGHEIGCHSTTHRLLWTMTPPEFADDLRAFHRIMHDAIGSNPAIGFRAPTFSIDDRTTWALEVLAAHGYRYDSSIFPVANYMYGVNGAPLAIYRPAIDDIRRHDDRGPVIEAPLTAWEVGGRRIPVAGGFYLRVLPLTVLQHAFDTITTLRPCIVYLHPWETDAGTPRVRGLRWRERLITYTNIEGTLIKLEHLLRSFPFAPLRRVLDHQIPGGLP